MELIDFLVVRSFWGNASFCYAYSPSSGNAGGILVIWDQNRFNKKRAISSDWFVAVEGVWISSGTEVVFVSVYALQGTDSKRQLWGEIGQLMSSCFRGGVVIMGDFNEVRDESKRMGSQFHPASARVFNQFIEDANLFDITLGGPRFTWNNKWGSKFSKLDRFLVSKRLLVVFPHLSGMVLEKRKPDHRPILLMEHSVDYGPKPFRFFHSWFNHTGLDEVVHNSWSSVIKDEDIINPWVIFKKKLQLLKYNLRVWYHAVREGMDNKRKKLQDNIESIDTILMAGDGTANLRE
ncbi:uncharacterized protein LOC111902794 [Lactuca sativa]|uniref:uncharacterized protein LOC111902794 n=1 Tax=Lactuca sativa TaxID=4236 RepID=UPI000CD9642F|nr:uncharacterized protein LOC111902794 [Lactuca sativa]